MDNLDLDKMHDNRDEITGLYEEVKNASLAKKRAKEFLERQMAIKFVNEKYDLFCQKIRRAGVEHGYFQVKLCADEWRKNYWQVRDEYILGALKLIFGIFNPRIEAGALIFSWEVSDKDK